MADENLPPLYIVTGSQLKFYSYKAILSRVGIPDLEWVPLETELILPKLDERHTGLQVLAKSRLDSVLKKKVRYYPFFVEQSGLEVSIWNGLPGGLSGLFFGPQLGGSVICTMLSAFPDKNAATVTTVIHYVADKRVLPVTTTSSIPGVIAPAPRGENGWGWESIFIPLLPGNTRTLAELSPEEKYDFYASQGPAMFVKKHWEAQHRSARPGGKTDGPIKIYGGNVTIQKAYGDHIAQAGGSGIAEVEHTEGE